MRARTDQTTLRVSSLSHGFRFVLRNHTLWPIGREGGTGLFRGKSGMEGAASARPVDYAEFGGRPEKQWVLFVKESSHGSLGAQLAHTEGFHGSAEALQEEFSPCFHVRPGCDRAIHVGIDQDLAVACLVAQP